MKGDLRLLDQYRLSFTEAYEFVAGAVRKELGLNPTGRPRNRPLQYLRSWAEKAFG